MGGQREGGMNLLYEANMSACIKGTAECSQGVCKQKQATWSTSAMPKLLCWENFVGGLIVKKMQSTLLLQQRSAGLASCARYLIAPSSTASTATASCASVELLWCTSILISSPWGQAAV